MQGKRVVTNNSENHLVFYLWDHDLRLELTLPFLSDILDLMKCRDDNPRDDDLYLESDNVTERGACETLQDFILD